MTKILTLSADDMTPVDLINGRVRIMRGVGAETPGRDGFVTRRYQLVVPKTLSSSSVTAQEALKELDAYVYRVAERRRNPSVGARVWLNEAAKGEVTFKRTLVYDLSVRVLAVSGIDAFVDAGTAFAEMVVTVRPFNESSISRSITASSVSSVGGVVELEGGGVVDGRIATLRLNAPVSVELARIWLGIRARNAGIDDFDPVISFYNSGATLPTGVANVSDADATAGYAVEVDHDEASARDDRAWTSISINYPFATPSHWNGRYRAILRYKIYGDADTLVSFQLSYGNSDDDDRTRLETVYLTGTGMEYQLVDVGEVVLPFHGVLDADLVSSISISDDCFFLFASEFISGTVATDHLYVDAIILIPAGRDALVEGSFDDDAIFFITSPDDSPHILFNKGGGEAVAEGTHTLSLPPEGGVLVVLAEKDGGLDLSDVVNATMTIYDRYGRYAGNG